MAIRWVTPVIIAVFLFAPVFSMVCSSTEFEYQIELNGDFEDDTTENVAFNEFIKFVKQLKMEQLRLDSLICFDYPEIHFLVVQAHFCDVQTPPPDYLQNR